MTQPLPVWRHLDAVLQRCTAHAWCAVLLDYDGTLAPLVADPATACLSPATRQVLTLLVQHPHVQVAIMSGRTLADLQAHVDGQVPYLAGNHGLEMAGPQAIYCHPDARRLRPELAAVAQSLQSHLRAHAGVWVEDKGLTLTVVVRKNAVASPPSQDEHHRAASRHDGARQGLAVRARGESSTGHHPIGEAGTAPPPGASQR